jgi:predicted RNA binding protein YcfA (HicA-like mRNA interferase family)
MADQWGSIKAKKLLSKLCKQGWRIKRTSGRHIILAREGWRDFPFSFHKSDEVGPRMLSRIAKDTGLKP